MKTGEEQDTLNLKAKHKVDADLIHQMMQLRNENFELKAKVENVNNFREIIQMELQKLRKDYEKAMKEKSEISKNLRNQREEILRLKKLHEDIHYEEDFAKLDYSPADWLQNREVYGRYITFLKTESLIIGSRSHGVIYIQ